MQVTHTYTDEDFQVLARYATRWWHLIALPVGCLLAALPGSILAACLRHELLALGFLGLVFVASLYWSIRALRGSSVDKSIQQPQTLTLMPDFVESTTRRGDGRWRWAMIERVVEYRERLLMPMGGVCWIVPVSAFPSRAEFDAFEQKAREYVAQAVGHPIDWDCPPPAGPLPAEEVQFEVTYRNARGDALAARRAAAHDAPSFQAMQAIAVWFGVGAFLEFSSLAFPLDLGLLFIPAWLFVVVGLVVMTLACLGPAMLLGVRMTTWVEYRDPFATLPRRLQVSRERVALSTGYSEQTTTWENLEAVVHDARYVFLFRRRNPAEAVTVPKSAFADPSEVARFLEIAATNHTAALERANPAIPPRVIPPRVAQESGNPYQPPTGERGG